MSDWLNSTERAIEVLQGQVAAANALGLPRIETDAANVEKVLAEVERLQKLYDSVPWQE